MRSTKLRQRGESDELAVVFAKQPVGQRVHDPKALQVVGYCGRAIYAQVRPPKWPLFQMPCTLFLHRQLTEALGPDN